VEMLEERAEEAAGAVGTREPALYQQRTQRRRQAELT